MVPSWTPVVCHRQLTVVTSETHGGAVDGAEALTAGQAGVEEVGHAVLGADGRHRVGVAAAAGVTAGRQQEPAGTRGQRGVKRDFGEEIAEI